MAAFGAPAALAALDSALRYAPAMSSARSTRGSHRSQRSSSREYSAGPHLHTLVHCFSLVFTGFMLSFWCFSMFLISFCQLLLFGHLLGAVFGPRNGCMGLSEAFEAGPVSDPAVAATTAGADACFAGVSELPGLLFAWKLDVSRRFSIFRLQFSYVFARKRP